MDTEKTSKTKKKSISMPAEIKHRTAGYILTALGLVAGLAWNDAIGAFIKYFFPADGNGIVAKFVYALVITFIIVVISNSLIRMLGTAEE